ncbi:MAG: glycosyltransferase [bacterium]|nr:glycosyltransferase [Candidatus Kapabacteria bacterium]
MSIKVAHVLWSGSFGGMTRAVYQLIRAQVEQSTYEPVLVLAKGGNHYFESLKEFGVRVIDLGLDSDKQFYRAGAIAKMLSEFDIHHFHATELTMAAASVLSRGATRVFTNRTGYMQHSGKQRMRYAIAGWYLRNYFHGFSGNTFHACRAGERLFGIPIDRWQVTYNGLEFGLHDAHRERADILAELGLPDDGAMLIGTAAQLRGQKRVDMLIDACALLPHDSFRLIILGSGPAQASLEVLARDRGIADRTLFAGEKTHAGEFINHMDAFILASTEFESFGNAAVEAMYHSVPTIVCNDSPGLLEHVRDGETGFAVSSADDMYARLDELRNDPELGARIGGNARAFITSSYTLPRMIAAYNDLYRVAQERSANNR